MRCKGVELKASKFSLGGGDFWRVGPGFEFGMRGEAAL